MLLAPNLTYAQDIETGLIGHWKLDETSGTTVIDYASNNNGTMVSGLNGSTDSVAGKLGTALDFDGSQGIDIASFDVNGTGITMAGWVYARSLDVSGSRVISKTSSNAGSNHDWALTTRDDDLPSQMRMRITTVGGFDELDTSGFILQANSWMHITATYDETSGLMSIYSNGELAESQVHSNPGAVITGTGKLIGIGDNHSSIGAREWGGYLDDIRIYNRALSSADVAELYANFEGNIRYDTEISVPQYFDGEKWNAMAESKLSDTSLIGHWKLDEESGVFVDSSGNGHDGTQVGGVEYASTGVLGNAAGFDGVDDFLNIGTVSAGHPLMLENGKATITFWGYREAGGNSWARILEKSNSGGDAPDGYGVSVNTDGDFILHLDGGFFQYASAFPLEEWVHGAITIDGTTAEFFINSSSLGTGVTAPIPNASAPMTIGKRPSDSARDWPGRLDDVRIYNRVLSDAEISSLYNRGLTDGLVGWWKLDEASGTTAIDSSGNNNDGSMVDGLNASTDSVDGMFEAGLEFDNVDDGIEIISDDLDNLTTITVAAWIKAVEDPDGTGYIYSKRRDSDDGQGQYFSVGSNKNLSYYVSYSGNNLWNTTANDAIEFDVWQHAAITWDGTDDPNGIDIYINGVEAASYGSQNTPTGAPMPDGNSNALLGKYRSGSTFALFDGALDDIRIYNRTLSATEIAALARHCTSPLRREGSIVYHDTSNVVQFCDGEDWRSLGPVPGAGGGGCSSPTKGRGALIYNDSFGVVQYCDGTDWVRVGGSTPTGCPNIGDLCSDGSIFAGDNNMYVTDVNQSAALDWKTSNGTDDINPDSLTDGVANNNNRSGNLADFPAFEVCQNLNRHGHSNWYLPAIDELNVLYTNRAAIDANANEIFTVDRYWSSSEFDTIESWRLNFANGAQVTGNKATAYDVRCIRRQD